MLGTGRELFAPYIACSFPHHFILSELSSFVQQSCPQRQPTRAVHPYLRVQQTVVPINAKYQCALFCAPMQFEKMLQFLGPDLFLAAMWP